MPEDLLESAPFYLEESVHQYKAYSVRIRKTGATGARGIRFPSPDANRIYLYPFEVPSNFSPLVNLDGDPEPEILINGATGFLDFKPYCYDFDKSRQAFTRRPVSELDWSHYLFMREVKDFLWGPLSILLYLFGVFYLVVAVVYHLVSFIESRK